jgi:hypothetical protein
LKNHKKYYFCTQILKNIKLENRLKKSLTMKQYVTLKVFKTFRKVRYYTFQIEGHDRNETDKFFSKLEFVEALTDDLNLLNRLILTIGERTGAISDLFRPEDEAVALPPKPSFRAK